MLKKEKKKYSKEEIDKILDIQDNIKKKKKEIKALENEKNLYLLDNSKYIFDYFESKKQISSGDQVQNVKVLNSFFKVKLMLSACARMTGTRMHVAAMVMSSVFQIFLVSFTIFISSSL